jgi:DNA-binding response OmpR family regulator
MRRLVVLHVEKNREEISLLARACEAANLPINLHGISDPNKAIEYLSGVGDFADRKRYPRADLVILDLELPGMGGIELLKWIRNQSDLRNLPVLVFTQSQKVEDKIEAMETGASGYFIKPPDFASLVQVAESLRKYRPPNDG